MRSGWGRSGGWRWTRLLPYPEPHYYQLFCYIYQARNLMATQIQTFQGRWQAPLLSQPPRDPMLWSLVV